MFKISNLELNFSKKKTFLVFFLFSNFEKRLLASTQMIIPRNKIEKMKIY